MLKPTYNHKHADTIKGLQDDVSNENTTLNCRHRPSGSPDLSFHSEDDSTFNKGIDTTRVLILSAPAEIYRVGLSPNAK
jgi:hypothetical protein